MGRGAGKIGAPQYQKLDKKTTGKIIRRLGKYILASWPLFIVAIALTLVSNQLALMGPMFSGDAIDAITANGGVDFNTVYKNIGYMIICYLSSAIMTYCLSLIMIHISQRIIYTMRRQVFEKLTSLPVNYFDTNATGDIISRISYDIDTVNATLSQDLVQIMTNAYTVIGSLIFMWNISKPMIVVFVITVPISIIFTRFRSKKVRPLFRERSRKLGELNGYAEEMLSGCRTIQAYNREKEIGSRFLKRNKIAMDAYGRAEYYGAAMGPTVNFINNLSLSLVMILGGILFMYSQSGAVKAGSLFFITLGGIAEFVQYSRKFAGPINEFANVLQEFQSAFSAAERVFRVIDEDPEPLDKEDAKELENSKGLVELKNVTFGYTKEKTVLYDLSVMAESGKTIAIVGPTGTGKTTIINLLMRFYDVSAGSITVDDLPLEDITRSSLRKAYTMVLQDTWLFHGTI
ncbi:MAG: ABC transporter ATP-binding protein, partial [Clostridia bacterium]|nr:ABC transporter ATP-binding protein [Clostridia bacterium]